MKFRLGKRKFTNKTWEMPRGVEANMLDYNIVVSLNSRSCYYVLDKYHRERYEPLYPPPSYGLNSTTVVHQQGWLWH